MSEEERIPIVSSKPRGPLDGIRVIDLTTVMLGPFSTQILGEMGADVIKVEPPGGDIGRWTGVGKSPGMSAAYMMKGRNKRSVVLDLKRPEAREPLKRLVKTADVFVHNIRPKAVRRLGIDYEAIVAWKADIVYAAATGFGEAGPYVDRPAYDDLIQGASGLAALFGAVTGTPRYGPSVLADKTTGLFLTYAITMALFHRERTGEGQRVHVPMYESFVSFIMNEHMQGRSYEPPLGEAGYQRMLTPHRRPFPTADGHICVLPYNDRHWARFFELAGRPELAADPRFCDQPSRSANIDALYEFVAGGHDRPDVGGMARRARGGGYSRHGDELAGRPVRLPASGGGRNVPRSRTSKRGPRPPSESAGRVFEDARRLLSPSRATRPKHRGRVGGGRLLRR